MNPRIKNPDQYGILILQTLWNTGNSLKLFLINDYRQNIVINGQQLSLLPYVLFLIWKAAWTWIPVAGEQLASNSYSYLQGFPGTAPWLPQETGCHFREDFGLIQQVSHVLKYTLYISINVIIPDFSFMVCCICPLHTKIMYICNKLV